MNLGALTFSISSVSSISIILTVQEVLASPTLFETLTSYFPVSFLVVFLIIKMVFLVSVIISVVSSVISLPLWNHLTISFGEPVNSVSSLTVDPFVTT
uniref:Uncharacterized protein n=1 Tax=Panstrongylus lignarius TaxID=156445 RepID=A0A224Y1N7_9HEMI